MNTGNTPCAGCKHLERPQEFAICTQEGGKHFGACPPTKDSCQQSCDHFCSRTQKTLEHSS